MRRVLIAVVMMASMLGLAVAPASGDSGLAKMVLSFDFSDNSNPPAVSGGAFNITVDVLPESTRGLVRMVAVAPSDANVANSVCRFQTIDKSRVACTFNFTAPGTWSIRAQYATDTLSPVSAVSVTNIRVGY